MENIQVRETPSDPWRNIDYENATLTYDVASDSKLRIKTSLEESNSLQGDEEIRVIDENSVLLYQGFLKGAGRIENNGVVLLIAKSLGQDVLGEQLSLDLGNTTNIEIFNEAWNNTPYSTDTSDAVTYNKTDYISLQTRGNTLGEITEPYNHYITFTPTGGGTVRYAELGSTTTGLSFNESNCEVKRLERNIDRSAVNTVIVQGQTPAGDIVRETVGAGSPTKTYNMREPVTSSEAQSIAQQLLRPRDDDITIQTAQTQRSNIVGQTINLDLPSYNINNNTYTILKQTVTLPTKPTSQGRRGLVEFSVGYDDDVLENKQRLNQRRRFLDVERGQFNVSKDTDVGSQDITGDTATNEANISTSENNRVPAIFGNSSINTTNGAYEFEQNTELGGGNAIQSIIVPLVFNSVDYVLINVHLTSNKEGFLGNSGGWDLSIENQDTNTILFSENNIASVTESFNVTVIDPDALEGDAIRVFITDQNVSDFDYSFTVTVQSISRHEHGSGSYQAESHNHNVSSNDSGHEHNFNTLTGPKFVGFSDLIDTTKE